LQVVQTLAAADATTSPEFHQQQGNMQFYTVQMQWYALANRAITVSGPILRECQRNRKFKFHSWILDWMFQIQAGNASLACDTRFEM